MHLCILSNLGFLPFRSGPLESLLREFVLSIRTLGQGKFLRHRHARYLPSLIRVNIVERSPRVIPRVTPGASVVVECEYKKRVGARVVHPHRNDSYHFQHQFSIYSICNNSKFSSVLLPQLLPSISAFTREAVVQDHTWYALV